MKTEHDYSEVKLCADDFFRFLEALAKDGFRFEIRSPYRVSPRPRLYLAFHGGKLIQSNSIDVPFTFGEMDCICNRWIPEFFGVECSHLAKLIARMTICFVANSPFPVDYVI